MVKGCVSRLGDGDARPPKQAGQPEDLKGTQAAATQAQPASRGSVRGQLCYSHQWNTNTCNNCYQVQYQDVQAKGHSWNGNHTCNTYGILNIAEAEAAIDDYARSLDREPKISIDQAAVSNGAYFVMTPVYSADYNRIVNNGHTAVDEIIAQMNDITYLKSVKSVIEYDGSSYTVKVYYIYGRLF